VNLQQRDGLVLTKASNLLDSYFIFVEQSIIAIFLQCLLLTGLEMGFKVLSL
jgi:hypothetical protein